MPLLALTPPTEPTITGPDGRTRGALYSNPFDCLWKTLRTEGFLGWYKGEHLCYTAMIKLLMFS